MHVFSDSQLVIQQVLSEYEAKETSMQRYLDKVCHLIKHFEHFEIQRIPMSRNKCADALSKLASTLFDQLTKAMLVETLYELSYDGLPVC